QAGGETEGGKFGIAGVGDEGVEANIRAGNLHVVERVFDSLHTDAGALGHGGGALGGFGATDDDFPAGHDAAHHQHKKGDGDHDFDERESHSEGRAPASPSFAVERYGNNVPRKIRGSQAQSSFLRN